MDPLSLLAQAYFHQDYDLVYRVPLDAVRAFKSGEASSVRGAVERLDQILSASLTEAQLRRLWVDELDAYYEPERAGLTYTEWFHQMRTVLAGRSGAGS